MRRSQVAWLIVWLGLFHNGSLAAEGINVDDTATPHSARCDALPHGWRAALR